MRFNLEHPNFSYQCRILTLFKKPGLLQKSSTYSTPCWAHLVHYYHNSFLSESFSNSRQNIPKCRKHVLALKYYSNAPKIIYILGKSSPFSSSIKGQINNIMPVMYESSTAFRSWRTSFAFSVIFLYSTSDSRYSQSYSDNQTTH